MCQALSWLFCLDGWDWCCRALRRIRFSFIYWLKLWMIGVGPAGIWRWAKAERHHVQLCLYHNMLWFTNPGVLTDREQRWLAEKEGTLLTPIHTWTRPFTRIVCHTASSPSQAQKVPVSLGDGDSAILGDSKCTWNCEEKHKQGTAPLQMRRRYKSHVHGAAPDTKQLVHVQCRKTAWPAWLWDKTPRLHWLTWRSSGDWLHHPQPLPHGRWGQARLKASWAL